MLRDITELRNELEKSKMAIEELLNEFELDGFEPNATQVFTYAIGGYKMTDKSCEANGARLAYRYLDGYSKVMWLNRVALDYMNNAIEMICDNEV